MFSRPLFALSLLSLPILTRTSSAQPPRAPSTVKENPANWNVAAPIPDPPLITPEELQTLMGGPTLVTFSGTDLPVDEVVKSLLDAAHLPTNRFTGQFGEKKLSVDWQQTPFWTAAAQIEAASGGTWDGRFGDGLGLLNFGSEGLGLDGAVAARTPFATLIANSLTRTATQSTFFGKKAAKPRPDNVQMTLTAYFDPKLRVQTTALRALKFVKRGETNPVAVAARPNENFYTGSNNPIVSQQRLLLPANPAPGTNFSSISGILHAEIAAATQTFAVPDLLATPNAELTIAGAQYRLQSVTLDDGQLTVRVRIAAGAAGDAFRRASPFSALRVRDAQARVLSVSSSTYGGSNGEFNFRLKNGEATFPGPYSLEWPIVTAIKSLDVPFELRDVTVP